MGQLTRRWPTPDGHILRATTPKECRPSSDPARCPCRPLGPPATVTPGRLLVSPVSPQKGRTNWLLSPIRHDTAAGPRRGVVEVVVVCAVCLTHVSVHIRPRDAPNWVAERLGASSRRPRHPFPALMAGVSPGRVPVHTALKNHQNNFTELQLWNLDRLLHVCTRGLPRAALWDSTVFSTPAPEELAAQPSHRTPCQ